MLAGYYDDFNGARAIPNDDNDPSLTLNYDSDKTHYGNPMNGEATLNPRYRWALPDRNQVAGQDKVVSATYQYIKSVSPAQWLTYDINRQSPEKWEGRAQLQYPDSHLANKYRFNNSGSDGYLLFCNGHDTTGSYYIPTGDYDSTFGREEREAYIIENYDAGTSTSESNAGELDTINPIAVTYMQRAHLTGCWMGERNFDFNHFTTPSSDTVETPRLHYMPHRSPSGMPFLCIQTYFAGNSSIVVDSNKRPAIAYDGMLNSRQDNDTFGLRFAIQSLSLGNIGLSYVANSPKLTIQIGFPSSVTPTGEKGYLENTNTAAIEWEIDLGASTAANNGLGGTYDYHNQITTWDGSTYDPSSLWIDLEFQIDYTNNRFTVYKDGTAVKNTSGADGPFSMNNNGDTGAAFLPSAMRGWQIIVEEGTNAANDNHYTLMIDRVGLYQCMTERADGTVLPPITDMKMTNPVNGISTLKIDIADDAGTNTGTGAIGLRTQDYSHFLSNIFTGVVADWNLLFFYKGIDRPIWRGPFEGMDINQTGRDRKVSLTAKDALSVMDRQVPLWELGELGENTTESSTAYWSNESFDFNTAFYMGATALRTFKSTVGLDKDDSYLVRNDQRTQIYSSHPIQMYNNEDVAFGPNNLQEQYEGLGVVGFSISTPASVGATTTTKVFVDGPSIYTTSSSVTITRSASHDCASKSPSAISTYISPEGTTKQVLDFATSDLAFTRLSGVEFIYAGKFCPTGQRMNLSSGTSAYTQYINGNYNFIFDADPGLKAGDIFFVPPASNGHFTSGSSTTNYSQISNQPLKVSSTKTIENTWTVPVMFRPGVLAAQTMFSGLDGSPSNLYVVTVTKQYGSSGAEYGSFTTTGGLTGDNKGVICRDFGSITPITGNTIATRAIHSTWMRDLANSLWFKYHFGIIQNTADATGTTQANVDINGTTVQIDATSYGQISQNAGLAQIMNTDGTADTFIWRKKLTTGGNYYLVGCSFISQPHLSGSVINVVSTSDSYKHCWLLWSDMRNDGRADADGSTRKTEFGIIEPTIDNYDVELFFVDQTDENGNPDSFTDLKLGSDVDLWEVDATNDPTTQGAFSKPLDFSTTTAVTSIGESSGALELTVGSGHGVVANDYIYVLNSLYHDKLYEVAGVSSTKITMGAATFQQADSMGTGGAFFVKTTGSEKDLTQYHDWEDKAGAFLVIDSAKFFNLNTTINGGKSGQSSGGRSDLGDYVATGEGFPVLIDNYWSEAMATYKTVEDPYRQHPNQFRLASDASTADSSILQNDRHIRLAAGDEFPTAGLGRVIARKGNGQNQTQTTGYISWDATNQTNFTGSVTSVDNSSSNVTKITDSSADFSAIQETINLGHYPYIINTTQSNALGIIVACPSSTVIWVATASAMNAGTYGTFDNIAGFTAASSDGYIIPPQLMNVFGSTLSTQSIDSASTPSTIEAALVADKMAFGGSPKIHFPSMVIGTEDSQYDSITVLNSVSTQHMTRLMMRVKGFIESPNIGTYFESDKMRMLFNAGLMKTWLPRARMTAMHDIANVPNTTIMTTDGTTTAASQDSFGSVFDARTKTIFAIVKGAQTASGIGRSLGVAQTFSYLVGRDSRIELRPKYNSGYLFDRSNLIVSSMKADSSSVITNVRVYYNNGKAFADFPTPTVGDTTRWKIIEEPTIVNNREAHSIAKHTFEKLKDSRISITASPRLQTSTQHTTDKMMTGGRFGYIADTHRVLDHHDGTYAYDWAHVAAGFTPFPGMVNAMDGNLKTSTDLYHRYGQSAPYVSITSPITFTQGSCSYNNDPTITHGANANIVAGLLVTGTGIPAGATVASVTDSTHFELSASTTGGSLSSQTLTFTQPDLEWTDQYYFYGANSLNYALQIVHVPEDMPYISGTTGNEMRVFVGLKPSQTGTDIDNAEFVLLLVDYDFSNSATTNGYTSSTVASLTASTGLSGSTRISSLNVKNSGFYEMSIPSAYSSTLSSAGAKIVVSFNAEYCRALLRHRCGDPTHADILKNAHGITGFGTSVITGGNDNSIFPLGGRKYSEFGDFAYGRSEWYAPRLHIVNDMRFIPGTFVTYTDQGLNLSNEVLTIQDVNWSITGRGTGDVSMTLERDESRGANNIVSYIASNTVNNRTGTTGGLQRGSWIVGGNEGPPNVSGVPSGFGPLPSGPANPSAYLPTGGFSPSFSSGVGGGAYPSGSTSNNLTAGAYGNMKGRMELGSDNFSHQSSFNILGQKRQGPKPGAMKEVEGFNSNIMPASGNATKTDSGMVLPGVGHSDNTGDKTSSIEGTTIVPIDALNNEINITGKVTCSGGSGADGQVSVLTVTASCVDTDTTITNTVTIPVGSNNRTVELLPTALLDGAGTYGNKIKVTVSRSPDAGSDTADNHSVIIHNVGVAFKRSAFFSPSLGSEFTPFE